MNARSKTTRLLATGALAAGLVAAGAGAANAAGPGGSEACPTGSFCLYYNSSENGWGSFENFTPGNFPDLSGYHFGHYGNGSGDGQSLYHNVAAIVNNTNHNWKLCTLKNTNVNGTCELFIPGDSGDVVAELKNNDASLWAS